jgi:hypothetical protein
MQSMKTSRLFWSVLITALAINSILSPPPTQAAQSGSLNCNGLQNFLTIRSKYGRSAMPQICSRNFAWKGRIDCSKGLPVIKYNLSMADAEWICKKLIYARGDEIPYRELRVLLTASGAIPTSSLSSGQNFKEVSCGNRLCTATWMLPDKTIIHVTIRRDGDQLATYE